MPRRLPPATPLLAFGPANLSVDGGNQSVRFRSQLSIRASPVVGNVEIWPDVITTGLHACSLERTGYHYREQVLVMRIACCRIAGWPLLSRSTEF